MNLYDLLSEQDKKRMENYVTTHGVVPELYIGNEKFFKNWALSKTKLYHLLGNKFIHKIPYEITLKESELFRLISSKLHLYSDNSSFYRKYSLLLNDLREAGKIPLGQAEELKDLIHVKALADNEVLYSFTLTSMGKKLSIQAKTKPIKALTNVLKYFNVYDDFKESLELFRLEHSRILNVKTCKGNLVMSIHPMDFMTMSDNANDWSSCMNWMDHGCYFMGSEEMMNSNNVICCYLESMTTPYFYFGSKNKTEKSSKDNIANYPDMCWTNKKWRTLFYVDKNIIVNGKNYPYTHSEMCDKILAELRRLAKENMNWDYLIGPQEYLDMKRFNADDNFYLQDEVYMSPKKAILFDTKAMYNDFMNDSNFIAMCVRNPVKKTKIISVSGKAVCPCCGKDPRIEYAEYLESYNDRIENAMRLVCLDCFEKYFRCDYCDVSYFDSAYYLETSKILTIEGKKVCPDCLSRIRICPDCNEPFFADDHIYEKPIAIFKNSNPDYIDIVDTIGWADRSNKTLEEWKEKFGFITLEMCPTCQRHFLNKHKYIPWHANKLVKQPPDNRYIGSYSLDQCGQHTSPITYDVDDEIIQRYFIHNLKSFSQIKEEN